MHKRRASRARHSSQPSQDLAIPVGRLDHARINAPDSSYRNMLRHGTRSLHRFPFLLHTAPLPAVSFPLGLILFAPIY